MKALKIRTNDAVQSKIWILNGTTGNKLDISERKILKRIFGRIKMKRRRNEDEVQTTKYLVDCKSKKSKMVAFRH